MKSVETYCLKNQKAKRLGQMNEARSRAGVIVFKQDLYVFGGISEIDFLKSIEKLNLES